jgi:hypothetical protein
MKNKRNQKWKMKKIPLIAKLDWVDFQGRSAIPKKRGGTLVTFPPKSKKIKNK